jgi:hypothetical protein
MVSISLDPLASLSPDLSSLPLDLSLSISSLISLSWSLCVSAKEEERQREKKEKKIKEGRGRDVRELRRVGLNRYKQRKHIYKLAQQVYKTYCLSY